MNNKKLKREIGLFEATLYGVGIILGAGIYVLIGEASGLAGNAVWLSFIIGAAIASCTGLCYAELSSTFPKAAAEYVYVKNTFQNNILAFLTGWLAILTMTVAAATIALGFAGYFSSIISTFPLPLIALILILILSLINYYGIKESVRLNVFLTLIEIVGLVLVIVIGMNYFGSVDYFEIPEGNMDHGYGFFGVFAAAALIFFAYLGFEDIANIAEETRNPRRNIPKALIYSIIITTVLYVLVAISAVSVLDHADLAESDAPLADVVSEGSERLNLDKANMTFLLSIIALFATLNTALVTLIANSRMIYGIARDGSLPRILSWVHPKRRTPAIAISAAFLLTIPFVLIGDIRVVAEMTNFGAFSVFIMINLSLIYFRYKNPADNDGKFKVPLNIGRFPVLAFIGILSCSFMLFHLGAEILAFGCFMIGLGVIFYFLFLIFFKIKL